MTEQHEIDGRIVSNVSALPSLADIVAMEYVGDHGACLVSFETTSTA